MRGTLHVCRAPRNFARLYARPWHVDSPKLIFARCFLFGFLKEHRHSTSFFLNARLHIDYLGTLCREKLFEDPIPFTPPLYRWLHINFQEQDVLFPIKKLCPLPKSVRIKFLINTLPVKLRLSNREIFVPWFVDGIYRVYILLECSSVLHVWQTSTKKYLCITQHTHNCIQHSAFSELISPGYAWEFFAV